MTVLVADPSEVFRRGMAAVLGEHSGVSLVGESEDGPGALALASRRQPDVLVAEIDLPGLGAVEIARRLRAAGAPTAVIALCGQPGPARAVEALRAGVRGFAARNVGAAQLVRGIREVTQGNAFIDPPLSTRALNAWRRRAPAGDALESLTPREREVLQLAADGLTNGEIGKRLYISSRTVEIHRCHAMRKLDLFSQTELVRYALRRGLISLGTD